MSDDDPIVVRENPPPFEYRLTHSGENTMSQPDGDDWVPLHMASVCRYHHVTTMVLWRRLVKQG